MLVQTQAAVGVSLPLGPDTVSQGGGRRHLDLLDLELTDAFKVALQDLSLDPELVRIIDVQEGAAAAGAVIGTGDLHPVGRRPVDVQEAHRRLTGHARRRCRLLCLPARLAEAPVSAAAGPTSSEDAEDHELDPLARDSGCASSDRRLLP